jgi:hypothetical protein
MEGLSAHWPSGPDDPRFALLEELAAHPDAALSTGAAKLRDTLRDSLPH